MPEIETLIPDFAALGEDTQLATARFLVGAKILEISRKAAHGVVETAISYLRHGDLHQIVYDETTRKLLGGTEDRVVSAIVAHLVPAAQTAVRSGKRIRKLKIKHDGKDHREWIHVHDLGEDGVITARKFEIDGSPKAA